jgi:hypothetical protein
MGRNVLLTRLVEKRTRNVPSTVAQKEDCVRDDLLCMPCIILLDRHCSEEEHHAEWDSTCSIRDLHAQNQDKGCVVWSREIVADQAADFLL